MSPSRRPSISVRVLARADRLSVAAAATAAMGTLASAQGALVTWNCNLVLPATIEGLYIDVVAQSSATDAAAVAGWNMNLYSVSTPDSLVFFASGTNPGYVMGSLGAGNVLNLPLGSTIGASSLFGPGSADVFLPSTGSGWLLNATNYFGFAIDVGGSIRYGYGSVQVGATGDIRTLQTLVYENSGASITIPGAVPAPGAIGLLSMAGLVRSRRRRFG